MNSLTDQYYSRLLSIARQNKGVRFIKDIKDDKIYVELKDGTSNWMDWCEVFNYNRIVENKK